MVPMNPSLNAAAGEASAWTCPFCCLLCDDLRVSVPTAPGLLRLAVGECRDATEALAAWGDAGAPLPQLPARIGASAASIADAVQAAADRLSQWRQPLFGGLGTDVAGARALYRLAARTGAICDHAAGRALMHGLRALQDRGAYTTTLIELRSRADLIVCAGTAPDGALPGLWRRLHRDGPAPDDRRIVYLHAQPPAAAQGSEIRQGADLLAGLQMLAAAVQRPSDAWPPALKDTPIAELATALRAARYAVFVWEAAALPDEPSDELSDQGALVVETIHRIVNHLNLHTRAAMFGLGGADGALAVNQTFTWLGGVPLRTRIAADALQHDPWRFDAQRLIARGAVDGLLWISSFRADQPPPASGLPEIVLGPLAMAGAVSPGAVFIPVATPGIDAPGHLFRTDMVVAVPLEPLFASELPGVPEVLARIQEALG
jgi:formylmethanofuran dehydrogenase subunit B